MPDFQFLFNIVLGLLYMLGGWLMNNLYQSLRDLTRADSELAGKVQQIEVLVAGTYIKRAEFESKLDAVFTKLDSIESKLDSRLEKINSHNGPWHKE